MTKEEIKNKVLEYGDWEFWFDRPFGAFLASLFKKGQSREYMKKVGVDAEWPATLFQNGKWYKSDKVWSICENELKKYDRNLVFEVVRKCEDYLEIGKDRIEEIVKS